MRSSVKTGATTGPQPTATVGCDIVLRDGSTLYVRLATPEDAPAVLALFQHLSPESVYNRFAAAHKPTPADAIQACTVTDSTVALVAERADGIVAVAQYCQDDVHRDRAEVAFTVADEFQGLGVGTRLLERLTVLGRARGITWFDAYVLATNNPMQQVLGHSGFSIGGRELEHGMMHVVLAVA